LNQGVGIKGSMVITKDGILVAARVGEGLHQDAVAALTASFIINAARCLERVGREEFQQFILHAANGKLVLEDAGKAFLVVIADEHLQLNVTILDIKSAAMRLKKELGF